MTNDQENPKGPNPKWEVSWGADQLPLNMAEGFSFLQIVDLVA